MAPELSEYQKTIAAQNIIERLALKEDLSNLREKLDELLKYAPVKVVESTSRTDLEKLITEIKKGTATNDKISRFLELAGSLGIK